MFAKEVEGRGEVRRTDETRVREYGKKAWLGIWDTISRRSGATLSFTSGFGGAETR